MWRTRLISRIYLAVVGLGAGGGQANSALLSSIQNSLGNGVFGVGSFFIPILLRYCSVRWFLILGPTGYAVYIACLMYFQARDEMILPIVLSVYFGAGGAMIWVSTTYISMAYATRKEKGHFVNNQWLGLAFGSVVGAAVAFGANIHKDTEGGVSQAVLGGWLAIHMSAAVAAFFLILPAHRVKTRDGSIIPAGHMIMGEISLKQTFKELGAAWISAPVLLTLLAMFTSDFWLVFTGFFNARNFSLRARSLNTLLYWAVQIPTAEILSRLLDKKGWTNRQRGAAGFCCLFGGVCASWLGYWIWQGLNMESASMENEIVVIDWADGARYVKGAIVYIIFGIFYPSEYAHSSQPLISTAYHVVLVFFFSMMAAEGSRLNTYYSGIFKGLQGTGICLAFGIQT